MPPSHALQQNIELTAAEVAHLLNYEPRHVRRLVDSGKIPGKKRLNERNVNTYYIPLSGLPAKAQKRYLKGATGGGSGGGKRVELPELKHKPLEAFTLADQERIRFWTRLLDEWQHHRFGWNNDKASLDKQFVGYATIAHRDKYRQLFGREFDLSCTTLYRRWRAFRENDLDGLLDGRGKALKGLSAIHSVVWDAFMFYYLDEAKNTVESCRKDTMNYIQEAFPELYEDIPSIASFYRRVKRDIPKPLEILGREGEKAFQDRCGIYIRRVYDEMESNEYWVADTHTLDVISTDKEGTQHRLYLVAIFDARSGIFVGWHITDHPSSQATLVALRKAIREYGIPKHLYVDNGREFLTHDVGGLGHRKRKKHQDEFVPPPVFERLGITMVNALVRNARAKIIERRFRDVKEHISRLFPTYTGGNILERPEVLKYNLKAGKAAADMELTETVGLLLRHFMNEQKYGGAVVKDRGKPRTQVYNENLYTRRVAREEDLNLLMMRSSRMQKVGRRGVHLDIGGVRYDFFNQELLLNCFDKKVFFRYDPEDLSSVRVYDEQGRFLTVAPVDDEMVLEYGAGKEDIAAAVKAQRRYAKAVKAQLNDIGMEALEPTEAIKLRMASAMRAKEAEQEIARPDVIELHTVQEKPALVQAVGSYISDRMLQNAEKHYGGGTENE